MKIEVKWDVSYDSGIATFDLEDVDCETEEEWNKLTEQEKQERLQTAIDNLPESPSMILDRYKTV